MSDDFKKIITELTAENIEFHVIDNKSVTFITSRFLIPNDENSFFWSLVDVPNFRKYGYRDYCAVNDKEGKYGSLFIKKGQLYIPAIITLIKENEALFSTADNKNEE